MAQTAAITANTTTQTSSDIVVTTTPVQLSLYSGETDGSFGRAKVKVQVKDGSLYNAYQTYVTASKDGTVYLTNTHRTFTLEKPGTYRLIKDPTSKSIGVYQDTTA